uniref:Putative secreted histamine binding protein of 19.7 kDa n=2 Tax=Ixodes ricinus TaxID=34613 RepID=A0A090XEB1_IXORI
MAKSSLIILFSLLTCIISDENQLQKQEDDPSFKGYQNVENMITQQPTLYMRYRTYNTSKHYECLYIKFGAKSGSTYPATTLGFKVPTKDFAETKEVTVTVRTTPYPKLTEGGVRRTAPNTLIYEKVSEDEAQEITQHDYYLIYADSTKCAVMRDSQRDGGYGCEMFVSDPSSQPTQTCKTMYSSSCGNVKNTVWKDECDTAIKEGEGIDWGDN